MNSYLEGLQAAIESAGLVGEFAEAAEGICKESFPGEDSIAIALCLVAQEIRNLALHVSSLAPSQYPGKR